MITIEEIRDPKYRLSKYPDFMNDRTTQRNRVLGAGIFHSNEYKPHLRLEFGVATGATINQIAQHIPYHTIYGFDSFYGLPENWIRGFEKGRFNRHGQPPEKLFRNIEFVVGLFADTLPAFLEAHPEPVAFLHIDCDLYSSTDYVLRALEHRIVTGTVIVFDELVNYPGYEQHEFKAFNEFLERTGFEVEILATNQFEQVAIRIGNKQVPAKKYKQLDNVNP